MLEKLSQDQQEKFQEITKLANDSYDVVFEGMRSFAEKLDSVDSSEADAHLLSVIKAAASLLVEGDTAGLKSIGKEVLASLEEYESFLEKYHGDKGGVDESTRNLSDFTDMMPDSLHAALDEYSKESHSVKASEVSKTLGKKQTLKD